MMAKEELQCNALLQVDESTILLGLDKMHYADCHHNQIGLALIDVDSKLILSTAEMMGGRINQIIKFNK